MQSRADFRWSPFPSSIVSVSLTGQYDPGRAGTLPDKREMKSMTAKQALSAALALVLFLFLAVIPDALRAQQTSAAPAVAIGPADIGGVVTSRLGPEAGVWVIDETTDLGTR